MKFNIASLFIFCSLILIISCGGEANKNSNTEKAAKKTSKSVLDEMKEISPEKKAEVKKPISSEKLEQDDQNSDGASKEQLDKAQSIIDGVSDKDLADLDPKKLFKINCALCHGFKGNMMINGAKDLTKSNISIQEAVAQVYHGKGLMTPYKGILSDAQIVALAKYAEDLRK